MPRSPSASCRPAEKPVSTPCNEVNCLTQKMLSEAEGYDILRKYEIPVPEYQIVKTARMRQMQPRRWAVRLS